MAEGKLYGARFAEGLLPELERFSSSLAIDLRLAAHDIAGSIAHARGLHAAGLLSDADLRGIEEGLRRVSEELASGTFAFAATDEDVHTAVERRLTELFPSGGARLHAGRSRNDQVAVDLRLWCRETCGRLAAAVAGLVDALVERARAQADVPMPGYTHLQRAQPVTVGHHLLAHAEPLLRDGERLRAAYAAADRLPLDRAVVARELGFAGLTRNSMDAVADRDFALDLAHACVVVGLHLSRLGEDVVLWASAEFGFVNLPDRVATGSSLMPQKKNPDIAELIRGRTGRSVGGYTALATVLKGLPMAYDRDLQEDRVALFAAADNAGECLEAAQLLVANLVFDRGRLGDALADRGLLATDSAEHLVASGMPFRQAHREVAAQVRDGRHEPPWDVARSLRLRRLDVAGKARQCGREAAKLRRWAALHPPELPG